MKTIHNYTVEGSGASGLYYTLPCGSKCIVANYQSVGWRAQLKVGHRVHRVTCHDGIHDLKVFINDELVFDKMRGDKTAMEIIAENTANLKKDKFGISY